MSNKNSEIIKVNEYFLERKEKFNIEVGEKLRKLRTKKGFSIEDIALRAVTSPTYIIQIENGKYGLSLSKFISICNSLELSPNEVLEEFLYGGKTNEDILYNKLQLGKDISKNIVDYMREKDEIEKM